MVLSEIPENKTYDRFTFDKVTVADLLAKFADHTTPVVISRKWAEQVGFSDVIAKPANVTVDAIDGLTPESKVQAKVRNFDEE